MTFRLRFGAWALLALFAGLAWAQSSASPYATVDHDDSYLYRLPYADAVSYVVSQTWGSPLSHTGAEHYTVDFAMPEGTAVHAAREGVVIAVADEHERGCWSTDCVRFANHVAIRHSDGTIGEYFHLQKDGALVAVGESVERGQRIAFSGNTGYTNIPHLHFGVYTTTSNGDRRSIDIRFVTSTGIIARPRSGGLYQTSASRLSVSTR